jgi:hypothetical protein
MSHDLSHYLLDMYMPNSTVPLLVEKKCIIPAKYGQSEFTMSSWWFKSKSNAFRRVLCFRRVYPH